MKRMFGPIVLLVLSELAAGQDAALVVTGLRQPTSATVGSDRRIYVTTLGEPGKEDGGEVVVLDKGKAVPLAGGFDKPRGLVAYNQWLFLTDRKGVWRITLKGKADLFAAVKVFPSPPQTLGQLAADPESGILYTADEGTGVIYRISPKGKISPVGPAAGLSDPAGGRPAPRALLMDGASFLLVTDEGGGLQHVNVATGKWEKVADGLGSGDGLAWDMFGRLFISDSSRGRVLVIPRPGEPPAELAKDLQGPTGLALDPLRKFLLVVEQKAGAVRRLPIRVPGAELDETPLPLETAIAFPKLKWAGWDPESKSGKIVPLRPIVLTHAGDGSNRVFVATQHGAIHVFPNDQNATGTQLFLDIQERVRYSDNENEEGFLGFAFHPQFKKNGEFYVFYTLKKAKLTNVLSRFRVSKEDPNRADPSSEEEILRVQRPFWNHDGGTIIFGPDGYLYVALGDGGAAGDPFNNGQNLKSLLGKILRIDVDRKDPGKSYAIPKDNPFIGRPDARPETWAWGLRNVWRMAFDKKTGVLWAGEVGQNLYEEINLITKGGNYGWRLRESLHPFGRGGVGPRPDFIEPIWEYHHDIGKSITGGLVYRGKRLPELDGHYLYGDYVSSKLWALVYDAKLKRVVANRPIPDRGQNIMSFGEDEQGEVYFLTAAITGQGIWHFVRKK
jgi:glucose/arabinose dehydrogenase